MQYLKGFLRSERGDNAVFIIFGGTFLIFMLLGLIVLTTFAIAVFRYLDWQHFEAGAALRYAIYSVEMQGQGSGQDVAGLNPSLVAPYFEQSYSKLTDTSLASIPGVAYSSKMANPVTVTDLTAIYPGQKLPSGIVANQPGYLVTLSIPMFPNANSLFNGAIQNTPVTVRYFVPVQPVPSISTTNP